MKKNLMALPIVGIVVAMLGASVFAAGGSSTAGAISATDANGDPLGDKITITRNTDKIGVKGKKVDAITTSGFTPASGFKASDYEIVEEFDVSISAGYTEANIDFPITIKMDSNTSGDDVVVFHDVGAAGTWVKCGTGSGSTVTFTADSLSPFAIAKAAASKSAQTGEYAGTYIIMVATALVACGAVFAIRAKKASK